MAINNAVSSQHIELKSQLYLAKRDQMAKPFFYTMVRTSILYSLQKDCFKIICCASTSKIIAEIREHRLNICLFFNVY